MEYIEKVRIAKTYIQEIIGKVQAGTSALVLGSGLGALRHALERAVEIPYRDIPHCPVSSVPGHAGSLASGLLEGRPVLLLQGRHHLYEGYTPREVCFGVRLLGELGVRTLVLTNASGGLNPDYRPGSLMLLTDHINLTGRSPLTGPNEDDWGPRFPDMSQVYSPRLRELALKAAREKGATLHQGVYMQVPGPTYETPAEARAFRLLGADAVGMSTVLEAVAARHMGMEVLGLSCVTNAIGAPGETTHEEVLRMAGRAAEDLTELLRAVLRWA